MCNLINANNSDNTFVLLHLLIDERGWRDVFSVEEEEKDSQKNLQIKAENLGNKWSQEHELCSVYPTSAQSIESNGSS